MEGAPLLLVQTVQTTRRAQVEARLDTRIKAGDRASLRWAGHAGVPPTLTPRPRGGLQARCGTGWVCTYAPAKTAPRHLRSRPG